MELKFYNCGICGNLIIKLNDSGMTPYCCGRSMETLTPQTKEEEFGEKHVPTCTIEGHKIHIKVGAVEHPHTKEHHIEWIYVLTNHGAIIRYLDPEEAPEVCLRLSKDDWVDKIFVHCNLHGLWMCDCGCTIAL